MKRNIAVIAVLVVTVAAMLYMGARKSRSAGVVNVASVKLSGDVKGKVAPDWELKTLDGKPVKLSDFRGKAVVVDFWATWCGPCKIEMPWFVELQKQYGPQGLEIVGIAMEDTSNEEIAKFVKEMGVNYTIVHGKEAVGEAYGGVLGLPTSFFVGRDGKIVDQSTGLVSRSELEDHIKEALAQGSPAASTAAARSASASATSVGKGKGR